MNLQILQEEFSGQRKQMLAEGANGAKVGRMSEDERLMDTIPALRVNDEVSKVVRGIVKKDRRTISDVARALLERGAAAYLRDGLLFEPKAENAEPSDDIAVKTINLGDKEAGGKKRRA